MRTCLVYLDDIVVFGRSIEELKTRLEDVFEKIGQAGLKLKPSKCSLFQSKLKYLGHIVSADGVECDREMLAPVKDWPTPQNVKQLQSFLGFANFYRRFMKGFANIADPLTGLLGCKPRKKVKKGEKLTKEWHWGPEQDAAFQRLKEALASPPLLAYPDFSRPFLVRTDASITGLGAVLLQDLGDKAGPNVIAYASRTLKPSEKHYSAYKLEFLALYWAVTKKFAGYLQGQQSFTVTTDHNPLTYVLTSAKLDSTGHRWLAELTNYNFDILYKPGKHNIDADALSRISGESVKAICSLEGEGVTGYAHCVIVQCSSHSVAESIDWLQEQRKDSAISRVRDIIVEDQHVNPRKEEKGVLRMLRKRSSLQVDGGILYRIVGGKRKVMVPKHLISKILKMAHDDMGHQGRDRTFSLIEARFTWPRMGLDIQEFIRKCDRCSRVKAPHQPAKAPLVPIVSTEPLDIVCMDYLSLEQSKGGFGNILVLTDHFTKYALAIPTTTQSANNTAKLILQNFVYRLGIPRRLHSDMGGSFEAKVVRSLCDAHGIHKSRTTPYHPESDGITERYNRTLLNMLRTLDNSQKDDWKSHVARLTHAYNSTPHAVTGYSPYYLMYGRHPRLPLDTLLGVEDEGCDDVEEYEAVMREKLQEAYASAASATQKARNSMKENFDKTARGIMPQVGDLVLVRKLGLKGKHKLADKWEEGVYRVESKDEGIPVYTVIPDNGRGRTRKLHRNHILPVTWPVIKDEVKKPVRLKKQEVLDDSVSLIHSESSSDEEMEDLHLVVEQKERKQNMEINISGSSNSQSFSDFVDHNIIEDGVNDPENDIQDGHQDEQQPLEVDNHSILQDDESQAEDHDHQSVEVDEQSTIEENVSQPTEKDERPSRNRRCPDFYQAGFHAIVSHGKSGEWTDKCQFLLSCMREFPTQQSVFANAIANVILA